MLIDGNMVEAKSGEIVLEIGVGGHGLAMEVLLKTKGLTQLVGIEISDNLRDQVSKKFAKEIENKQLTLFGTDCKDLNIIFPLNNSVDCILAINVIYFLHPLKDYLRELYRVLKPRTGRVLFSCKSHVEMSDSENTNPIFKNMDFDSISRQCQDVGFNAEVEKVHFEENSFMNDFTLIKLDKL